MAEYQDLPLIVGELAKGITESVKPVEIHVLIAGALGPYLLDRNLSARAEVIEGRVASNAKDPSCEGRVPFLVLADRDVQLREDVLSDVLGLVMVADDGANVAEHVI